MIADVDRVGRLITGALLVHGRLWQEHDPGLTPPQCAVLFALAGPTEIDHRAVGELTSLQRWEVADVVRRLERRGWLTRVRAAADGRRTALRPTIHGHAVVRRVSPVATLVEEALLDPLPPGQRDAFRPMLTQVAYGGATRFPGADSSTAAIALRLSSDTGHLLRRIAQIHAGLWSAEFGPAMSPGGHDVVSALLDAGGTLDRTGAARAASLDRPRIAVIVQGLERTGWVCRVRDERDARRRLLRLTPDALNAASGLLAGARRVSDDLLSPLDDAERGTLLGALAAISAAVTPARETARAAPDDGRGPAHRPRWTGEARVPDGRSGSPARAG